MEKLLGFTLYMVTVNFKKAQFGKQLCMPLTIMLTTSLFHWTVPVQQIDAGGPCDDVLSLSDLAGKVEGFWMARYGM